MSDEEQNDETEESSLRLVTGSLILLDSKSVFFDIKFNHPSSSDEQMTKNLRDVRCATHATVRRRSILASKLRRGLLNSALSPQPYAGSQRSPHPSNLPVATVHVLLASK